MTERMDMDQVEITCEPNALMASVHDRMPVIVRPSCRTSIRSGRSAGALSGRAHAHVASQHTGQLTEER